MKADTLVIIPTYNEAANVKRLVPELMQLESMVDVLFVDDNSPDGTRNVIASFKEQYPDRVHLLAREKKAGLGSAYVAGFKYALEHPYTYICEMDADFSHDPNDLPRLINVAREHEPCLVIGSRYHNGISIVNWPLSRLILSYSANVYARIVTGLPVFDTTAGFKCFHRDVLESVSLDRIKSNGYAFQIEMHFRAWKAGFNLREVSIIFREREEGESKMSRSIIFEAVWMVWALKLRSFINRL